MAFLRNHQTKIHKLTFLILYLHFTKYLNIQIYRYSNICIYEIYRYTKYMEYLKYTYIQNMKC